MSFLNLRGEMLHCSQCNKSFTIEYEGGAKTTQVGDENVQEQQELNERYMPQSYNAKKDGYYFHRILICEDCINSLTDPETVIFNGILPIDYITFYSDQYRDAVEELMEFEIDAFAARFDKDFCLQQNPDAYEKTLGNKKFKLTCFKEELIKEYILLSKHQIVSAFQSYIKQHPSFIKLSNEYRNLTSVHEQECTDILNNRYTKYFEQITLDEKVNLNPYICSEGFTIRERIINVTPCNFYDGPHILPLDEIDSYINSDISDIVIPSDDSDYLKVFEAVIREIKKG